MAAGQRPLQQLPFGRFAAGRPGRRRRRGAATGGGGGSGGGVDRRAGHQRRRRQRLDAGVVVSLSGAPAAGAAPAALRKTCLG